MLYAGADTYGHVMVSELPFIFLVVPAYYFPETLFANM